MSWGRGHRTGGAVLCATGGTVPAFGVARMGPTSYRARDPRRGAHGTHGVPGRASACRCGVRRTARSSTAHRTSASRSGAVARNGMSIGCRRPERGVASGELHAARSPEVTLELAAPPQFDSSALDRPRTPACGRGGTPRCRAVRAELALVLGLPARRRTGTAAAREEPQPAGTTPSLLPRPRPRSRAAYRGVPRRQPAVAARTSGHVASVKLEYGAG